MKVKLFFILFTLQFSICKATNYGDEQIIIMLNTYFKNSGEQSLLLGHHFYNNQNGTVFQIEIQTKIKNLNDEMIGAFLIINQLADIAKTSFTHSIVIIHFDTNFLPVIAKSELLCSKRYFIYKTQTEQQWRKNCLSIQNQ